MKDKSNRISVNYIRSFIYSKLHTRWAPYDEAFIFVRRPFNAFAAFSANGYLD
jgi:hypothetical protein